MAINGIHPVTRTQICEAGQTSRYVGNIDRTRVICFIIEYFEFFIVSVSVKLSGDCRLESIDNFVEFSTVDCPTVFITRWNVCDNMYLFVVI